MKEPIPQTAMHLLSPKLQKAIRLTYDELEHIGYAPRVVETLRSEARQRYLYGIGRTHHLKSPKVTWTMDSKHLRGQAVDTCEATTGYHDHEFFHYLGKCGATHGLRQSSADPCHLELISP